MKFQEINATEIQYGIIAHGVNRQLAMGSGIAGALARKWPIIREQYLKRVPVPMLGQIDMIKVDYIHGAGPLYVANCYSQEFFGPGDKKYADPDAIGLIASRLLILASCYGLPVYIPRIGCELGGLNWYEDVKPKLLAAEEEMKRLTVDELDADRFVTEFIVIDVPGGKWGNQ